MLLRIAASDTRKSTQGVRATHSAKHVGIGVRARVQRRETADAFAPFQRVEIVLGGEQRRRIDGRTFEQLLIELSLLGHTKDLRQRPCEAYSFPIELTARGERINMPCAASPPSTFCQEKVTTSHLDHSIGCANAALVASLMVMPCAVRGNPVEVRDLDAGGRAVLGEDQIRRRTREGQIWQRFHRGGRHEYGNRQASTAQPHRSPILRRNSPRQTHRPGARPAWTRAPFPPHRCRMRVRSRSCSRRAPPAARACGRLPL